jgi:uncharacterized membrane protein
MGTAWVELDKKTRRWLAASALWASCLLVAAVTLPVYDGSSSQTLVQANGYKLAVIAAIPLATSLLTIWSILVRLQRSRSGVSKFTWTLVASLCFFSFLGILTIGPFVAPVPICLLLGLSGIRGSGQGEGLN